MHILDGFSVAMGGAAVAVALTVLNFGGPAGLGLSGLIAGLGLFAYRNNKIKQENATHLTDALDTKLMSPPALLGSVND